MGGGCAACYRWVLLVVAITATLDAGVSAEEAAPEAPVGSEPGTAGRGNVTRAQVLHYLLAEYDVNIPPNFDDDEPLVVMCSVYIYNIADVNEKAMDSMYLGFFDNRDDDDISANMPMEYSVTMMLTQEWIDPRLNFSHLLEKQDPLTLDPHMVSKLWTPGIVFTNEKRAQPSNEGTPNSLVKLNASGLISYSHRLGGCDRDMGRGKSDHLPPEEKCSHTVENMVANGLTNEIRHQFTMITRMSLTLSCPMKLQMFPLDSQICNIDMETIAFDRHHLVLHWQPERAFEIRPDLHLSQFQLVNSSLQEGFATFHKGQFSMLHIHFLFSRDVGYYIIQTYVPSILIVILSWVGFWIDAQSVPARIALGVTTVLTMTTQTSSVEARLPKVSYLKAMDVWLATCSVFVFSALLEYAIVNVMDRKIRKNAARSTGFPSQDAKCNAAYNNSNAELNSAHEQQPQGRQNCRSRTAVTNFTSSYNARDDSFSTAVADRGQAAVMEMQPSQRAPGICCGLCCSFDSLKSNSVDKMSRKIFPIIFVVFNIVYWPTIVVKSGNVSLP